MNKDLSFLKNKSFIASLAIVGVVAVVAIVLVKTGALESLTRGKDTLAIVGGEKITKQDLNEKIYSLDFTGTVENPKSVDDSEKKKLLQELIDAKVAEIEAKKLGVQISSERVLDEVKIRASQFDSQTDIQKGITKKNVYASLLKEELKSRVVGWKEGSYIIVRFDKNFASDIGLSPEQKAKEDIGREQRVAEDTKYAKELVDSLYADINSGKITFEEGMEKAKNDPKVGVEGFKPLTVLQSDRFTKEDFVKGIKIFQIKEAREKILKLENGKVSNPFTVKLPISKDTSEKGVEEKDGFWLIVKSDKGQVSIDDDFEEWFEGKKKDLNINIFQKTLALLIKKTEAHSAAHSCESSDHWGMVGGSSRPAGMVVSTYYFTPGGLGPYYFDADVNIRDADGVNGDSSNGIQYKENWSLSGTTFSYADNANGWSTKNFRTGSPFSYNNGWECGWENKVGRLILGYGYTSGIGNYGYHGNKHTLGCAKNPYTVTVLENGPGTGSWAHGVAGLPSSVGPGDATNFSVANGSTSWVDFRWNQSLPPSFSISKGLRGDIDANFDVKDSTDISTIFKITVANSGGAKHVQVRDDYAGQKFDKPAAGNYYWRPTGIDVANTTGFTITDSQLLWDTRDAPGSYGLPSVDIVYRATLKDLIRADYERSLDPSQTATITNTARIFWIDAYYQEDSPMWNPGSGYTNRTYTQDVILRDSTVVAATPACELRADPDNGQVPLSVDFDINPSGVPTGSSLQYYFAFDDGSINDWGDIANINHTYVKAKDTYNPTGKIKVNGGTPIDCPNAITVTVDPWSEGNPIEVAP